ncbi:cyclic pyranopterin monophosphate synthase MoaC [Candidatus Corynebacterium faecigallinarum]|uniref:cyclic pyranopterin monophosphate synthase MoaC n=1 Tax=Candidatus Corynebacterium faecigallinarum TaxID=2838528 RepID=UPI003FD38CE7
MSSAENVGNTGTAGNAHLTHVREDGSAHMVDVTAKNETSRTAVATGRVITRPDVLDMIFAPADGAHEGLPKGDALPVARVAGIMGAKKTPEMIPLCHPLPLGKITVDFAREDAADAASAYAADAADADVRGAVRIEASVKTRGVTGVEMEALTAVTSAALTVYDMIKAVDKHAVIDDVRVLAKSGGKSGDWDVR